VDRRGEIARCLERSANEARKQGKILPKDVVFGALSRGFGRFVEPLMLSH
jgi:hypothetical protein